MSLAAIPGGGIGYYFRRHYMVNVEASELLPTNDITNPRWSSGATELYFFSIQVDFQHCW